MLRIPANLRAACADGSRAQWLAALPDVVATLSDLWSLEVREPFEPGGQCAWVAPARWSSGEEVALKVGWPHPEADGEAAGLALWDGDGAVRLLECATVGNELRLHADPADLIDHMADLAEVDPARLRLWTFARCAVIAVDDPTFLHVAKRLT